MSRGGMGNRAGEEALVTRVMRIHIAILAVAAIGAGSTVGLGNGESAGSSAADRRRWQRNDHPPGGWRREPSREPPRAAQSHVAGCDDQARCDHRPLELAEHIDHERDRTSGGGRPLSHVDRPGRRHRW